MDSMTKEGLRNRPGTKCAKCSSPKSHTNPMAKCFECKKMFCFNHIFGGQINKKMKINEIIRDVCKVCREKFNYHGL